MTAFARTCCAGERELCLVKRVPERSYGNFDGCNVVLNADIVHRGMKRAATFVIVGLTLQACAPAAKTPTAQVGAPARNMEETSETVGRRLLALLAAGDYARASAMGDATMQSKFDAAAAERVWTATQRKLGAFQRVGAVRVEPGKGGNQRLLFQTVFERGEATFLVVVDPKGLVAGFWIEGVHPTSKPSDQPFSSASYVNTNLFAEHSTTVGTAPYALPATVSVPKSNAKHAAVVFVHGSGPLDRDESVGALKPFRDLAQGFASAGIVSLRYDKRAFAYKATAPELAFATFEASTIDDACAAIDAVRREPSVDPASVFVVGHSLGGYALPTVAAHCKTPIAGLIALAPAGRALQDIIVSQREAQLVASEPPSAAREAKIADLRAQAAKVRALPTTAANDPPASELLGVPASYWRSLDHASFPKRVSAISVPTVATFGGNDVQVTSSDAAVWEALAQTHEPRETIEIRRYPSLNHFLFSGRMEASTPLTAHTVDADLVRDLVDWIRAHSRTSGS